jgi:hypothetical protein
MKKVTTIMRAGILGILFFAGCSKDSGNNPLTYGVIDGRIMKASDSSGIASANVTAYNANTNSPITRAFSDTQGYYHLEAAGGTYYLKVAAQGFFPCPRSDDAPLPFSVAVNDTVTQDAYLSPDPGAASSGSISGTVTYGTSGISGVLIVVVRETDSLTLSGVSGPGGFYILYNLPAGTYAIHCYLAGYVQVSDTAITVSPNASLTDVNLPIAGVYKVRLSGKITFLAIVNSMVDITLVHPITRDAIPGLTTINNDNNDYSLSGIPPGKYIAWASFRNDGYVMDPDWIRKNGLPFVTFSTADTLVTLDFSVTGAITIVSPTNPADSVYAVPVTTAAPEFTWEAYPSTKEYIIEISDRGGTVIWGGFDTNGVIRHAQIDQHTTSAVFNFDSSATDTLKNGESYRWKIYADNDAAADIQGLISASEDLMGLFKVVLP